jgi:hypothetical protein
MPKVVEEEKKAEMMTLMEAGIGEREIHRKTGVSRTYIRKFARHIGHSFPRNGFEIKAPIACCINCGAFFRRPPSKITRAKNTFCSRLCREAYQVGENHPQWKTGESVATFSKWAQNQSEYKHWRQRALDRAGHKCEITGVTKDLHVHHLNPKQEKLHPEKVFDDDNALVLSEKAHKRIHELIREGYGFEESVDKLREEYNQNGV